MVGECYGESLQAFAAGVEGWCEDAVGGLCILLRRVGWC